MSKTHLIIPDSHAKPGVSNRRYEWLGRLIKDIKPDVIVNIGDHADMESLSSYDRGTKGFEGRRYSKDILAAIDASERLEEAAGSAWRNARTVMTVGNHEDRITRATNAQSELDGTISVDDLAYEEFYDEVHPFKSVARIDGINYCHYFTSGVMGRPIGGEHPAYQLVTKIHETSTQGHNHLLDYCRRTNSRGHPVLGLTVGCYFEHKEEYAGPANRMYWRGIILKRNVGGGNYDLETISLDRIKKEYA